MCDKICFKANFGIMDKGREAIFNMVEIEVDKFMSGLSPNSYDILK